MIKWLIFVWMVITFISAEQSDKKTKYPAKNDENEKSDERNVEEKNPGKWHYDKDKDEKHPADWSEEHKTCGGINQSPLAFWDDDIIVDEDLKELRFRAYDYVPRDGWDQGLVFENNGHTLKINLPEDYKPTVSGGNLNDEYRLVQMHFHWGPVSSLGSEHTFGDDHFPMEMHFVHIKENLTLDEALQDPEGLAVVGVLFEVSNEEDNALSPITDQIDDVDHKGMKAKLKKPLDLYSLLPRDTSNFFTYHGSLTTPPCSEVVVWMVFTETHAISAQQLQALRNVHVVTEEDIESDEPDIADKMLFNHRPTQPANGRKILARRHKIGLPRRCLVHMPPKYGPASEAKETKGAGRNRCGVSMVIILGFLYAVVVYSGGI